ncbi:MAG: polyprenyl synthetase family protein [Gammaproteobacteria bacterium]|nr:polyprenyl synthetase family protein [Gammaproteobacteria bacterium]
MPSPSRSIKMPDAASGFTTRISNYRERVETALARWMPDETDAPERLHAAMRYAVLAPGKRIRPLLVYATGETLGVPVGRLDGPACAIELIHAYSLVHDDLPAMDDDDLRRGRPTCHRAYDEATAILVGDALQTLAFEVLARDHAMIANTSRRLRMTAILARAGGSMGMAGGQMVDIEAQGKKLERGALDNMHAMKTGALIRAAVLFGAHSLQEPREAALHALERFGTRIGLAFQIQDDILDASGDSARLGKQAGADAAHDKPTYTGLLGVDEARRALATVYSEALEALEPLGEDAAPLVTLSRFIVERDH